MHESSLHHWLSTPEAERAARKAVAYPTHKLPSAARTVGQDELYSEALAILTECALPPRERLHSACAGCGGSLDGVRKGAKFCSQKCKHSNTMKRKRAGGVEPLPAQPKGHIGSMWTWPEDEREAYAARQVGMVLCNYLRSHVGRAEIPASPRLESANIPVEGDEPTAREVLEDYLTANGVEFDGSEATEELAEAAQWLRKTE